MRCCDCSALCCSDLTLRFQVEFVLATQWTWFVFIECVLWSQSIIVAETRHFEWSSERKSYSGVAAVYIQVGSLFCTVFIVLIWSFDRQFGCNSRIEFGIGGIRRSHIAHICCIDLQNELLLAAGFGYGNAWRYLWRKNYKGSTTANESKNFTIHCADRLCMQWNDPKIRTFNPQLSLRGDCRIAVQVLWLCCFCSCSGLLPDLNITLVIVGNGNFDITSRLSSVFVLLWQRLIDSLQRHSLKFCRDSIRCSTSYRRQSEYFCFAWIVLIVCVCLQRLSRRRFCSYPSSILWKRYTRPRLIVVCSKFSSSQRIVRDDSEVETAVMTTPGSFAVCLESFVSLKCYIQFGFAFGLQAQLAMSCPRLLRRSVLDWVSRLLIDRCLGFCGFDFDWTWRRVG